MSQISTYIIGGGSAGSVFALTGNTGGAITPTLSNINVVGDGTTIEVVGTPGTSTLTISSLSPNNFIWSVITANQTAAINHGYICNKAGTLALALPAVAAVGSIIEVTGMNNALGWEVTQAAGQQIFIGTASTTIGVAGSLASSATRDSIRMVCIIANTTWNVISSIGNITFV
jgi:hypothetical protein